MYNNIPYVAYEDLAFSDRKVTVMKFNSGTNAWEAVGSPGFSSGGIYDRTSLSIYNGTPYVAYTDGANGFKATVMKFNGTDWVPVGALG
jgi:hypothetical protein